MSNNLEEQRFQHELQSSARSHRLAVLGFTVSILATLLSTGVSVLLILENRRLAVEQLSDLQRSRRESRVAPGYRALYETLGMINVRLGDLRNRLDDPEGSSGGRENKMKAVVVPRIDAVTEEFQKMFRLATTNPDLPSILSEECGDICRKWAGFVFKERHYFFQQRIEPDISSSEFRQQLADYHVAIDRLQKKLKAEYDTQFELLQSSS